MARNVSLLQSLQTDHTSANTKSKDAASASLVQGIPGKDVDDGDGDEEAEELGGFENSNPYSGFLEDSSAVSRENSSTAA